MKTALLMFALVLSATAQSNSGQPAEQQRVFNLDMNQPANSPQGMGALPTQFSPVDSTSTDVGLHADVMQYLELLGVRQKIAAQKPAFIEQARKKMIAQCPRCSVRFIDELAKRIAIDMNMDDFIKVYAAVYEKYLTQPDVDELIEVQKKINAHQPPSEVSPQLRDKVRSLLPSIMGDITGGCTKVGAEVGMKAARELEQEHPEFAGQAGAIANQ
ncbi:MAG: hypothetical protein WA532_00540 [Candidatus Korobacteraceae bacterium]